jgi:choline dehydrogenase-like flavoprotein
MTNDKTELPSMTMISKNQTTFDAIVIGGGHKGLVAASCLAQVGKAVLLLEAQDELMPQKIKHNR